MAIPKEEREELRAAIKRTSRPTRDYLPTDAADHRLIRAAPQRLLDALDEAEAERIELRAALIASGNAVGASLSDKCSSRFLCLVPAEVTLVYKRITAERGALKARLARLLKTAIELREVAFDGPIEPKSLGVAGCAETLSEWKQRIDRESSAAIAAAKEPTP